MKNVNMNIEPGSFVCITGETGTGKSTLVNLITVLEKCTSGYVSVGGVDVRKSPIVSASFVILLMRNPDLTTVKKDMGTV